MLTLSLLGLEYQLQSYSLMMWIAAISVMVITMTNIRRTGLSIRSSLLPLTAMVLSVPIGARILNVIINPAYYDRYPEKIFSIGTSGFSLMGGLLMAAAAGWIISRFVGISPWKLGDVLAPGLGVGLVLMRMGCLLNGCCYGLPTDLPWAISYPFGSLAHKHYLSMADQGSVSLFSLMSSPAVHPTQIYEMFGAMIAVFAAIMIMRKNLPDGASILAASGIFTLTRLINHFFRVHPETNAVSFMFYPAIYLTIILGISYLFYKKIKRADT
ncbi:MAG: prolipoprotein diacylglyceryl transferase [Gudongella sp.]|nr:prolipoprotein diacylglyceryl transferase [Gudongella sp.]